MQDEFSEIDLRRIDLNLLLVLSALMRERSVTRAAGRLFMGPSAVSMALRRLRALFGDELFVRTRQGMEPTARALELYAQLGAGLQQIHAAIHRAPGFDPQRSGRSIRFASPDDLEVALLPRLVDRLAREAPGMTLIVRPSDFRIVPGLLDSGEADLALTATPPGLERRHRREPVHRDAFAALYVPAQLELDDPAQPLTLERYLAAPHVLLSPAGDTTGPLDRRLHQLGLARRVKVVVARFSTVPHLLRAAPLIANMPAFAARHYAQAFGLAVSPLPFASPTFEVSLVWHARADGDPAVTWFKGLVRTTLAALGDAASAAQPTSSRSDR